MIIIINIFFFLVTSELNKFLFYNIFLNKNTKIKTSESFKFYNFKFQILTYIF